MLQDPNVERYVEQAMKPVLKQIKELKAEVELLKKALHKTDVIRSLPGGDDINSAADDYGFRVPYDGTNNFYDETAIKHFHAGVRWYEQFLTGNDV